MPKPTLAQRTSFKTWLRKYRTKFANTTIPEFYIDSILSEKAVGISTTDNVRVVPFANFGTVDITNDVANDSLFYLPALTNDQVTVSFGSTSLLFKFVGEDQGISYNGTTYTLNSNIPIGEGRALTVKGLGGALLQSSSIPIYNIDFVDANTGISTDTIEEGQLFDIVINTQNVSVGSQVRVDFEEEPGTGSDRNYRDLGVLNLYNGQLQSSAAETITIAGSASTSRVGAFYDWRSNENDVFRFVVRPYPGNSSGTALTSKTLTVTDVDLLFDVTVDKTTVNEGDTVNVTFGNPRHPVTGISTYMPEGPAYATIEVVSGGITDDDFSDASFSQLNHRIQTGHYSGYGSSSSTSIEITNDFLNEGVEVFYVAIRGHSYTDPIVARSPDITIIDTSKEPGAQANGLTFGPVIVNRDSGNPDNITDWYKICKIDDLPEGSSIALFIDQSGSMTLNTVRASYDAFVAKLNEKNITITTVANSNEDWITPFLVDLP
jgi:hypothetical protein